MYVYVYMYIYIYRERDASKIYVPSFNSRWIYWMVDCLRISLSDVVLASGGAAPSARQPVSSMDMG